MQILPPGKKRSCWYRNRVMKVKGEMERGEGGWGRGRVREMKRDLVELTEDLGL